MSKGKVKELAEEFVKPNPNTKTWTVTQRFTEKEVELLDEYAKKITELSGVKVKRAWIIRKMLELGQQALEKEYGIKVKR